MEAVEAALAGEHSDSQTVSDLTSSRSNSEEEDEEEEEGEEEERSWVLRWAVGRLREGGGTVGELDRRF